MATMPSVRTPRLPQSGSTPTLKRFALSDITTKSDALPNRWGLHAREGFGKTSLAAYAPNPIFLQSRGETGLDTLIASNQLPETPHFPEMQSWEDQAAAISFLTTEEHPYKTLVLDTVNGLERLCYEFVCNRDFDDDWGNTGFGSYQKGYEVSLAEWRMFLNSLDELRRQKKMTIFMLFHSKIKTFANPDGANYDRWSVDMHEKTYGLTLKWLDALLFGNYETAVKTSKDARTDDAMKKGKAVGTIARVLYTEQRPTFDAKNRFGLPPEIDIEGTPKDAWAELANAVKAARVGAKPPSAVVETKEAAIAG
jgi:hypothetical protein